MRKHTNKYRKQQLSDDAINLIGVGVVVTFMAFAAACAVAIQMGA